MHQRHLAQLKHAGFAMTDLKLLGTITSPYVRRVRVVARELGLNVDRVDTAGEDSQAQLRRLSPIWKIPAAVIDGRALFDSTVICEHLLSSYGPGAMTAIDSEDSESKNFVTVVDGALDALINVFYLGKDGVDAAGASYVAKQSERAASAMAWLVDQLAAGTVARHLAPRLPHRSTK